MRYRLRTLMIATATGPPAIAVLVSSPDEVIGGTIIFSLLASVVIPIWAGVRRAEILKRRRAGRELRRLEREFASNT